MLKKKRVSSIEKRALTVTFLVLLVLLALCTKTFSIQVVNAEKIIKKAKHLSYRKVKVPSRRGEIFDRNGSRLAITVEARKVIADPLQIENKERASRELSEILGIDEKEIYKKLNTNRRYVCIAREVPLEKAIKVTRKSLGLVYLERDYMRIYPYGALACHVIGFVSKNEDEKTGQSVGGEGLEYTYNKLLTGKPGYLIAQVDAKKNIIPGTVKEKIPAADVLNIVITIDKEIQYFVEKRLEECVKKQGAKGGSVVVMNPKSGEILAMASYPSYDLNNFSKVKDMSVMVNKAIRFQYEPGSTIKALTVAAVIEDGILAPDSKIYLPEKLEIGSYKIGEAHHRQAGSYSVEEILTHSYNVGAVRLAQKLGPEKLYHYLVSFGLSQKTGIDLNGEQTGYVPPTETWSKTTIANLPFGQGLSATPLQVLRAISVFANDGIMVQPFLLKYSYNDENGTKCFFTPQPGVKVISRQTAEVMTKLLEKVVTEGTGKLAKIPGYSTAGKTGTAQIPDPEGKGYLKGHYIASFVGFAPTSNPEVAIIVVIEEPKKERYGGQVAAPVFKDIGEFALKHLRVLPDENGFSYRRENKSELAD